MKILISNTSDIPLYQQIKDQIKDAILKEELVENDPLPSIRAFANDLKVSVLTIRRVYEELEQEAPGELCAQIESAPEKQMLLEALGHLGEEERAIVLLHDAGNMKHREIAEYLGYPLSTVLSRYRRALKRLHKILEGQRE